jgi:hypothetical protein
VPGAWCLVPGAWCLVLPRRIFPALQRRRKRRTAQLPEIFVSHRREDTGGHVRGPVIQPSRRFADRVFRHWAGIALGEDFVAKPEAIGRSWRGLLPLIGSRWVNAAVTADAQTFKACRPRPSRTS